MPKEITFGEWLHQRRRMLDLTQQELADKVGCARITLRRIESDALKPSKELALILLETLGIPQAEHEGWLRFARGQSSIPSQVQSILAPPPRTNLPPLLTSFIGREKELDQVTNLLEKYRLVTLVGPGGVGKTRLSLKVGEGLLAKYADGVWLVELAPLNNPDLVAQSIAFVFGLNSASSLPVTEALINFLRLKIALLIFDNCEHVLDACVPLADNLLKQCPNLKILATSREALGILGEASYPVPSLGVPEAEKLLASYREYESVRLFEERAGLVRFDFSLTIENASSVAQICQRLDGIPLAIELAAVHVDQFSPAEIAAQLADSFKILTGGSRTALRRHQTLRASMDWSWDLLTEPEQMLMRQLSVFSGGWTLGAALAVCEGDVFGLTSSLIKKSLIVISQEGRRETRYNFHEIVHQYAVEKFLASGDTEVIHNRHLRFFLAFAEEADSKLHGPDQNTWLNRLEAEHSNLGSALGYAITNEDGSKPETVVEAGLRLSVALFWFWRVRGYSGVGSHWMGKALIASESPGLAQSETSRQTRGKILAGLGWLSGMRGDLRTFYVEERLASFRELGDHKGIAGILNGLGVVAEFQGDFEQARMLLEESVASRRIAGDKADLADTLTNLGRAISLQGDNTQAMAYYDEALVLARELEDQWLIVYAIYHQGFAALFGGDPQKAMSLFKNCLSHFPQYNDKLIIAYILWGVGETAVMQGKSVLAARMFGAGESLSEEIGWVIPKAHRAIYDFFVATLRAQLDEAAFATAWVEGRSLTMERAIQFALDELNEYPSLD